MSELKRGLISVGILVLVISIIYLVIQNYKESRLSETETKGEEQKQQQQQDPEAKLQTEKDKVDTLVDAMQNHSTTEGNITEKTESPF